MVSVMNEYVSKIHLLSDDVTKGILNAAMMHQENIRKSSIIVKSNKFIVDIKLNQYSIENAVVVMRQFMEQTSFHYSSYVIRFNEGNLVRYRYASCKENKDGFYCDVVIS